jgi:hypothetical protein
MTNFQWDNNDLEKLLGYCQKLEGDITSKAIMTENRFRKSRRRNATALDIRYLMQLAVKKGKARVTKGFLVDIDSYAIRLLPQEKPFSDELFQLLSTFSQEEGWHELLPNRDLLKQSFPEIGDWSEAHESGWKKARIYWRCMRSALFTCQFRGGNIEELPRCIDKEGFVLRLQWLICQYKALQIYLNHKSLQTVRPIFDYGDGKVVEYLGDSIEVLFVDLLTAHASVYFASPFTRKDSKKISATTKQKYLNAVRNDLNSGTEIVKGTPISKGYRRIVGDDLFDFKSESSKMYYFSSGTWFRLELKELGDPSADKACAEWDEAEDRGRKYQIKNTKS